MIAAMDDALLAASRLQLEGLYVRYPHLRPQQDLAPPGWAGIVAHAVAEIAALERDHHVRAHIAQTKQKWGTLRIYAFLAEEGADRAAVERFYADLAAVTRRAHARSERTCEVCGASADLRRRGGFVTTTCEAHADGAELLPPPS